MQKLLTTQEVANYFGVDKRLITQKFIKMGLKYIPIGSRDYRYEEKDVEEFANYLKELAQQEIIQKYAIKRKIKHKNINIDYEKRRINLELNKVV